MPHRKLIARLQAVVGLSEQDQAKLARMPYKLKNLDNGAFVARQGERPRSSTVVMSGFLCRQKVISDRNQISSFYLAGDMPDLHTLHLPVMDHELCSVGSSTIASVSHDYLREVMDASPRIMHAFWRETLIHGAIYREWVENLGGRQAIGRIAHLLCELATRLELIGLLDNGSFHLPFTQQNIADACGLSAVHVNRTLQQLRSEHLVEWQHHTVRLLDRTALEDVAEFDRAYLHTLESVRSSIST
ncbi:Crp/Fnr family transcriptional regulator [Bradyrhizobium diazoefficiens]|uniref:Crp/Fnr family transcriptional regulator n=1 Tax=Bradyrhizobium diazoefficiens TaxID=1355477 RepID=UPI00190A2A5D|nr:Crp/Fnr family transcriptional regulator [Bradyrhizobium diazoefficiens]MBK3662156.1 Crp/Fnr family transcriptional regulator [Bradyrhizobium diazoefficiens]